MWSKQRQWKRIECPQSGMFCNTVYTCIRYLACSPICVQNMYNRIYAPICERSFRLSPLSLSYTYSIVFARQILLSSPCALTWIGCPIAVNIYCSLHPLIIAVNLSRCRHIDIWNARGLAWFRQDLEMQHEHRRLP